VTMLVGSDNEQSVSLLPKTVENSQTEKQLDCSWKNLHERK